MGNARIKAALRKAVDTKTVLISNGTLAVVAGLFAQSFGVRSVVIVADENTWQVAAATLFLIS